MHSPLSCDFQPPSDHMYAPCTSAATIFPRMPVPPCGRLEVRAAQEAEFREAYSGPLTSSKVTGLAPGTNYLFRCALSPCKASTSHENFSTCTDASCTLCCAW